MNNIQIQDVTDIGAEMLRQRFEEAFSPIDEDDIQQILQPGPGSALLLADWTCTAVEISRATALPEQLSGGEEACLMIKAKENLDLNAVERVALKMQSLLGMEGTDRNLIFSFEIDCAEGDPLKTVEDAELHMLLLLRHRR